MPLDSTTTQPTQAGTPAVPPSTEAPHSGAATEPQTPATLRGAGLRYGAEDPVPEWAKGKTADEVLGMAQQLYSTVASMSAQPQGMPGAPGAYPAPQPQMQPQGAQPGFTSAPDPQLMYSDPAEYQRQYDRYNEQRFQGMLSSVAAPFAQALPEMARETSRRDPNFSEVWQRYAPEIEAEVAGVPMHLRNVSLYNKAAEIVQGRHWRSFAKAEAERMLASGSGTERAGMAGGVPAGPAQDALDAAWDSGHPFFENAKAFGTSKEMIRSHVARMGTTVEEYVRNAQLGNLIQSKHGIQRVS